MRKIQKQRSGFDARVVVTILGQLTCSYPHDMALEIWKQREAEVEKRFGTFQKLRAWVNNYLYNRPDLFTKLCERGEGGLYTLTQDGKELYQELTGPKS